MNGSEQSGDDRRHARASSLRLWDLEPRHGAILAAIVLSSIAIYLPSLRNGWVWDDRYEIEENKLIHSWSFVWKSFIYDSWWFRDPAHLPHSGYYRPLQNVWFAANALLFGIHPAPWHLAASALHAMVVVVCFRLAQLLSRDVATGLLTAAIFAVMPAHAGPVAWASAIPEPLSTVFELGAMLFLIKRRPGWSRGLIVALILFACAMLTHESAILFPLIVAAYVFLFEGAEANAGTRDRATSALRTCAPFVAVVIAYMCARIHVLGVNSLLGVYNPKGSIGVTGFFELIPPHSLAQLLMTLPVALIAYLGALALPGMAGPAHAVQWITHPQPLVFIAAAALVLLAAAAVALAWRSSNRRIYLFCAAWSFLTIAPALNLNGLWWLVDDRYLYAPSFGWSLAVAVAALSIAAAGARARKAVGAAMAVLLASYVISTIKIEPYWHDDVTFFQRCVEIAPDNSDYRLQLATVMSRVGDHLGAARQLERVTVLQPDKLYFHLWLAHQYQMAGRPMDFEREFRKFSELSAAMRRQRAAQSPDASQPAASAP